jgi:hypothetical protein
MARTRTSVAGAVGAIERHHGGDDPRLPEMRRELRALSLEEHIAAVVDEAPPLTAEQRDRLVGLLHRGGSGPPGDSSAGPRHGSRPPAETLNLNLTYSVASRTHSGAQ